MRFAPKRNVPRSSFSSSSTQTIDTRVADRTASAHWELSTPTGTVSLTAAANRRGTRLTAQGDGPETRRVLRNVLIRKARLEANPTEHHVLSAGRSLRRSDQLVGAFEYWSRFITERTEDVALVEKGRPEEAEDVLQGIWWDRQANFGDAVGPWLASTITGRPVVNVRSTKEHPIPPEGRATALVGSIMHMINRPNTDVWGTGLMRPVSSSSALAKLSGVRVHAVRGHRTRDELITKLGWEVPEVLGDPALLLPRHLRPRSTRPASPRIVLVPHSAHRSQFKSVDPDAIDVCDVRNDLTTVVNQIANSAVCVSTSLHGLIVAQAYGVPWVWLNITDAKLGGGTFKFEDFFSTLRGTEPARYDCSIDTVPMLDLAKVASHATLPDINVDLDALEAALPWAATPCPGGESTMRHQLSRLLHNRRGAR